MQEFFEIIGIWVVSCLFVFGIMAMFGVNIMDDTTPHVTSINISDCRYE